MPITSIQMGTTGQSTAITISTTIPSSKRPKTTLLLNSTRMSNCLLISLVLLLLAQLPIHSLAVAQLPICKRHQACAAEVAQFPLLSETAGNMVEINVGQEEDGSGQGSGQEVPQEESFPFYDEFVSRSSPFDYQADADLSQTQICRCPSEENDGQESTNDSSQCNFLSTDFSGGAEHVMSVDKTLRLAFCRPVNQLFKNKCLGRRGLIRVIGQLDVKTGEAISTVNDTAVFCRCDSGFFQRENIEPWGIDQYAFNYRCAWTPPSSLVSL